MKLGLTDDSTSVAYEDIISPSASCQIIANKFGVEGIFSILQIDRETSVVSFDLEGIPEGKHSVHIHERQVDGTNWGDAKGHYDPYKNQGEDVDKAHNQGADIWNMGVINSPSDDSELEDSFYSQDIRLYGETSVINRSIVIHEKEGDNYDDGNRDTGAGGRIACWNINYT